MNITKCPCSHFHTISYERTCSASLYTLLNAMLTISHSLNKVTELRTIEKRITKTPILTSFFGVGH